jgi:hypothetical protein
MLKNRTFLRRHVSTRPTRRREPQPMPRIRWYG